MANHALPSGVQPIAVNKNTACAMLNLSPTKFAELVVAGSMPKARCVGTRRIWIVSELSLCAASLPEQDEIDTWADL